MHRVLTLIFLAIFTAAGSLPSAWAETLPVSQGHTALWYQPARSGEGWVLEVLDPSRALVYWFTYDEQGGQRWLMDVGEIEDNRIVFPELLMTRGGRFGPDFDPDEVEREVVGEAVMVFEDCDSGYIEYDAFGQTQLIEIQRLTRTAGLPCGEFSGEGADARAGLTGSWYDRSHSGEGYTLQWMASGGAVLIWFTYDTEGGQYWIIGVGEADGEEVVFTDFHTTQGARFGPDFDAGDVERLPWGELRLALDCESGEAGYDSDFPEFGSGGLSLTRLTLLDALDCDLEEPAPEPSVLNLNSASWTLRSGSGPALSELPAATIGDDIYVAVGLYSISSNSLEFWRYRPASEQWTRLANLPGRRDHGMMAAHGGKVYFFGGYRLPVSTPAANTWRYDPAADRWDVVADMPAPRAAGGAAPLGDYIYVMGGSSNFVLRYDPAEDEWAPLQVGDPTPRDHSAMVALDGELWMLGGRDFVGRAHAQVTIFDPVSGTMRAGPSMRDGRSGFAATVFAGHIVVAGGESLSPNIMVPSAEVYSPHTGQWQFIAPSPVAVHGAGAVAAAGRVYLMLGSNFPGGIQNPGHVQVLEIPEG